MVTGGPSSAAIFVEMLSAAGTAGALGDEGAAASALAAAGSAWFAGGATALRRGLASARVARRSRACAGGRRIAGAAAAARISGTGLPDFASAGSVGGSGFSGGDRRGLGLRRTAAAGSAGVRLGRRCNCGEHRRRGVSPDAFCSAAGVPTRSSASTGLAGSALLHETWSRGRRARRRCWRTARGRRAAAPRRRARTPVSTSTGRSRRTENESRAAWKAKFRLRVVLRRLSSIRERGDD